MTDDFSLTLTNRIDPTLHNDGPYILWMIGHNIHRSNIAFVESIKRQIRSTTLQDCHDDVPKYLDTITQYLRLITSPSQSDAKHVDLLSHLFQQLCSVTIPPFKDACLQWHLSYLEGKNHDLDPKKLITLADDKVRLLKHANQWKEETTPAVMALHAKVLQSETTTAEFLQQLTAHLTTAYQQNQGRQPSGEQHTPYPDWMITPPTNSSDTIHHANNRQYTWCTRCHRGEGLWVSTHHTATHQDNFKRQRRQSSASSSSSWSAVH